MQGLRDLQRQYSGEPTQSPVESAGRVGNSPTDEYGEKQKPTDDDNETNFANIGQDIELKRNTHKQADNAAALLSG